MDDEIDLLKGHIVFLEKKGYAVQTCSNGPDAIDLCRENNYDLILLDENMPGLSGLETLAAIKETTPNVPIVMVTKNEAEDLMDQAIGSKIADYLLKPVNPKQILLTLKKNIHRTEIQQEVVQTNYRQEFARISMQIGDDLNAEQWKELYKKLVHWELELDEADESMREMLGMQKTEANLAFAKFIKKNYENWIANPDERPLISPDLFKKVVFPKLSAGRKVFLLVLDNLRFDQWRALSSELAEQFDIEENLYFSILPTATQYARNAIFAGLMPEKIRQMYPDLWVDEDEDEGKNLQEEALIRHQLERYRRRSISPTTNQRFAGGRPYSLDIAATNAIAFQRARHQFHRHPLACQNGIAHGARTGGRGGGFPQHHALMVPPHGHQGTFPRSVAARL